MHVQDVADGLVALLDSDVRGAVNVASGQATTLREIVLTIGRLLERPDLIQLGAIPARANDAPLVVGDNTRLRHEVGWTQQFDLEAGLRADDRLVAGTRRGRSAYERRLRSGNGDGRLRRGAPAARGGRASDSVRQAAALRRPHRIVRLRRASTPSTKGPHVSFTKHERLQKLFADSIDEQYETLHTKVNNYWKGHWVKHPAQVNLYGLPPELIVNVITDFVEAQHTDHGEITNYEQWLRASFGDTFAETFPMQYTIKYHTTEAKNKSLDWIGPRLYQAKLEEVLRGALMPSSPGRPLHQPFRYPSHGGFVSYLKRFMESADLRLGHALAVDRSEGEGSPLRQRRNGAVRGLVSSVPLPELIPRIEGAPRDVVEAAAKLACTEVVIVNLVVNRPDLLDAHWTYIYDQDIFFTRLSTPHLQSPHNVPPGCGSIQAECYYSQEVPAARPDAAGVHRADDHAT